MISNRLALTILSFCMVCSSVQTFAGDDGNLVTNPGFELVSDETGFAQSWEPTYWSNPHGEVTMSDQARSGDRCVMITGVPPAEIKDATPRNNNLTTQRIDPDIMGMRKLRLSVWFRCGGNAQAYCSMMTRDVDGNQLRYVSSARYSGKDEWSRLFLDVSTDPETAQLTILLRNEGEGPAWFDDISLAASDDVLEHDLARVHVEPFIGGRVRAFVVKATGRDMTFWDGVRPGGFAADIVPGAQYPGALRDSACQMRVLEARRRVLLTHGPLPAPQDGLLVEKEISLRGGAAAIDVQVRVTNGAAEPRSFALRAQQCLPPRETTITVPMGGQLRVIRHDPLLAKWGMDLNDLDRGWIGCSDDKDASTVLMQFDSDEVTKAYLYRNQDLQTVEWYYREVTLAPGDKWETTYTIAALPSGAPIVAASPDLAIGLTPLSLGEAGQYAVAISGLRASVDAQLSAKATGEGALPEVERDLTVAGGGIPAIELPWDAAKVRRIELSARVGQTDLAALITRDLLDESPLMDLPPPPERMAQFPAATGFFPYGEYYRGVVGSEAGSSYQQVARFLRAYRRCYMNTYMVGEGSLLGSFRETGASPLADMIRAHRMRAIPRADMMRRFERDERGGITKELPAPEEVTRELVLERIRGGADYSPELRKQFLEAYGDLMLAYDYSDEPGGQYIPMYMLLQSVYREIDPDHPVLVILNLNRTEFLPFMPIYYGDEYPIRHEKKGGRNPWGVTRMVRFCATHTKAPVWVMLQAFGGLPEYTWQLPNEAEMRLTIYEAIANGAKGLTFHGSCSPPCWRYNMHYFETAIDSWGVEEPGWSAMRDAGKWLTAIGPALLTTSVSDDEALRIECEEIGTDDTRYQGPALKAGVLTRNEGGWFAVVVNQDIEQARAGTLTVNTDVVAPDSLLFDLYDLKAIGPAASAAQPIELAPGDGRIYFVGTQAQADDVIATVHRGHYDSELPLYEIDAALAQVNGSDIAAATELADAAAQAAQAGDLAVAHEKIVDARMTVAQVIAANPAVAGALAGLSEAHETLSEIARVYRDNFDVVMPPDDRKTAPRNQIWTNERDPKMQSYVDQTAGAFLLRWALEDRVYAGEADQVADDVARLITTSRRLHEEAIAYVRAQAQ